MAVRKNRPRKPAGLKKRCQKGVDGSQKIHYTVIIHLGFATVLRFSPHFEKWSPGLQYRYVKPPSLTPGDGRCDRQGTSLLHIAGEKTGTSAPWASKASGNGGFFHVRTNGGRGRRQISGLSGEAGGDPDSSARKGADATGDFRGQWANVEQSGSRCAGSAGCRLPARFMNG